MVTQHLDLRGATLSAAVNGPLILERTDADFITNTLEDLKTPEGRTQLLATAASTVDGKTGLLKLFQPVHKTFNLVLFEAVCLSYGTPRLDPAQIESAGVVIRRLAVDSNGNRKTPETAEGWRKFGKRLRGWVRFDNAAEEEYDPDPSRRPPPLQAGNAELNRRLAMLSPYPEPATEDFTPLFVAPPDVCAAAGRTILYGVLSLTSSEFSEIADPPPTWDPGILQTHLPTYVREGGPRSLPLKGQTLNYASATNSSLKDFIGALRQFAAEFGALETPDTPFMAELNKINMAKAGEPFRGAGAFVREAIEALVVRTGMNGGPVAQVVMPENWPAMSAVSASAILNAAAATLRGRFSAIAGSEGRYEDFRRQYRLQAFMRVRRPDNCPPKLVWSNPSDVFLIAPWFDNSNTPPVRIVLPDLSPVRQLKPNVTFGVPDSLAAILQNNDPKDMVDGKGSAQGGIGFDWICSFSLPSITICAFIVLNIFLSLFDIIFQWMLFIKICIPIPKKK
ncbi:MAG: hypothetical protein SGI92_05270 [Bryobacteraceae bacterium]|nr:hypothetical protein [Bryobacteraceae bacterium]